MGPATDFENGMPPAEDGNELSRWVNLVADRALSIRQIVSMRGSIKLAVPLEAGTRLPSLVHPDDLLALEHAAGWCAKYPGREIVLRLRFSRGEEWWTPLLTTLALRPDGGMSISLELDSAVAARAAEQQMRRVVDGAHVGIVVRTVEKVLYVNHGLARMMGYDSAQQLMAQEGAYSTDSIHPDDMPVVMRHLKKRLTGEEKTSQYEFRLKRRDGIYVWVETNASLVIWDGVPASLSWLVDVEARKKAQTELINSREAAERANRIKSDFLANMSHELRTPLNAIIGFSEMISKAMLGALNPRYCEYADDIHKSGQHLLDLINDILDLAKLEAGKLVLKDSDVDLGALMQNCLSLVRAQTHAKSLAVDLELAPDLPHVRADARALKQVVLNFLSNAVKFTTEGGRIATGVRLGAEHGLEIFVSDTGIGMTPEEIKVAMEPFGQVSSHITHGFAGTGLGLPISLALMKQHGGDVRIVSVPGSGTTMLATLPADRLIARAA